MTGSTLRQRLILSLGGTEPTSLRLADRRALSSPWPEARIEQVQLIADAGEPVRAFLTGPATSWVRQRAVLYCHAHGNRYDIGASELVAGRPALLAEPYALALARKGIVALAIDLPCFGDRQTETESARAKRELWTGRTLFGRMLSDLRGAFDVLAALEGVDPAHICTFGVSMGATLAFWLAAFEGRIRSVAHLCCFADLATLVATGAHDLHGAYMTVPGLLNIATTGEIAGLVAPRRQLVCLGALDPLTPPAAVAKGLADLRAAYTGAGAGDALSVQISPHTGHVETPELRAAILRFLSA